MDNKLIDDIEALKAHFETTANKIVKDLHRQQRIMEQSDKRQRQEYDELQQKLEEIKALQKEIEEGYEQIDITYYGKVVKTFYLYSFK